MKLPAVLLLTALFALLHSALAFTGTSMKGVFPYVSLSYHAQGAVCKDQNNGAKGARARKMPQWFMTKEARHTRNPKLPRIARRKHAAQAVDEELVEPVAQIENQPLGQEQTQQLS